MSVSMIPVSQVGAIFCPILAFSIHQRKGNVPESEKHVSCPCVKVANAKVGRFRDGHQDRINSGGSVTDGKDVAEK